MKKHLNLAFILLITVAFQIYAAPTCANCHSTPGSSSIGCSLCSVCQDGFSIYYCQCPTCGRKNGEPPRDCERCGSSRQFWQAYDAQNRARKCAEEEAAREEMCREYAELPTAGQDAIVAKKSIVLDQFYALALLYNVTVNAFLHGEKRDKAMIRALNWKVMGGNFISDDILDPYPREKSLDTAITIMENKLVENKNLFVNTLRRLSESTSPIFKSDALRDIEMERRTFDKKLADDLAQGPSLNRYQVKRLKERNEQVLAEQKFDRMMELLD